MSHQQEKLGIGLGFLSALSFASMSIFVKLIDQRVSLLPVLLMPYLIGIVILSPWYKRHHAHFDTSHLPWHLGRAVCGLGSMSCFYFAINKISLVNATIFYTTAPLFIPIIAWIVFRTWVSFKKILGLCIGFLGIYFILQPTSSFFSWASLIGLMSGFFGAGVWVCARKLSFFTTPTTTAWMYNLIAFTTLFIPTFISWQPISNPILWYYLIGVGFFGSMGMLLAMIAVKHAHVAKVGLTVYFEVVVNVIIGWIAWNEIPSGWGIIGILLVVFGSVITILDRTIPRKDT